MMTWSLVVAVMLFVSVRRTRGDEVHVFETSEQPLPLVAEWL